MSNFTPRTALGNFKSTQWYTYAAARTGIEMPNCFTYATGRISEIVGYNQPLDPVNNPVPGAQDLWYTHHENFTNSSEPCEGALMIWQYGENGHVAVCENSNGTAWSQSNYGGVDFEYITGSPYGYWGMAFLGYLVHKDLGSSFDVSQLIAERARATFTVDQLNARVNGPTSSWICRQYNTGDTVEYNYKWVGNGHRYIAWYEAENLIMVAVNGNEAGTEPWATFAAIDDTSGSTSDNLEEEHGWAKYKVDQVNVRKGSTSGDVVGQINSGTLVEYNWKTVTSSHRYIVREQDGEKYFIACSPTSERSTEWADFYAENPDVNANDTNSGNTDNSNDNADNSSEDNPNGYSSVDEGEVESSDQVDEVLHYEGVTVDLVDKNKYQYKCPYTMEAKYIIIHNAATPNGTADSLNKALHNSNDYKSWHFSVDEKSIIESLPLNRNGFATGDGAFGEGNRRGIHVEIARDNDDDSEENWKKARANGARLAAILLNKYGWGIDKVKKHQDFKMTDGTYKYCPHKILDEGWDAFLKEIQTYSNQSDVHKKDDESSGENQGENSGNSEDSDSQSNTDKQKETLIALLIKLVKKLLKCFK